MMLEVKAEAIKVPENVKLTKEAMNVLNDFKAYSYVAQHKEPANMLASLCLVPFNDSKSIDDILSDGLYDFKSENPYFDELKKLLDELENCARFLSFTPDDIVAVS